MGKKIDYENIKLEAPFEGDRKKIESQISTCSINELNMSTRYYLKKNVYWVKGAVNSVLHDFNSNILYWINKDTTLFLDEVLNTTKNLLEEARQVLLPFVNAGIITNNQQCSSVDCIESIFPGNKVNSCYIELTQKCNLKCRHCYNSVKRESIQSLTLIDFKRIVDELVDYGVEKLQLIGGEPFLINNKDILDMLEYASPRFIWITIFTNGTLLTEEIVKLIKHYSNVSFSISLYSFIEEQHDIFTGINGSFNKTLNAINILKKNNVPAVYTGVHADGLEIGENKTLEKSYGLDFVRLAGKGSLKLYNKQLLKQRLKTIDSLDYEWSKENVISIHNGTCFSRLLYISSDLDVFPCAMERRLKHGNLKDNKLSDIINRDILCFSKNSVDGCKDCEFRYICITCPPDSLSGKLNEKPWNCTYDVYHGKWMDINKCIERIINFDNSIIQQAVPTGGCKTGILL